MSAELVTGPAASWLRIKAVARRHGYVMLRSPHRLFDVTVWPLVDVLLFGSLGVFFARQAEGDIGRSAFAYLLGGIILWHVVYQSQISLSTGFLEETWSRNLLNLMVTPMREIEFAAGVVLFGMVKLLMGVGCVIVLAVFAFSFDLGEIGLFAIPVTVILLAVGWVISLFVIGLVLRFGSGAEALAWGVLFVLLPMSGVFYPVESLPGFLQPIARVLPTTHAFAATRAVIDGDPTPWDKLGMAALTTVVSAVVAVAFLARMMSTFRKRGYVTRYS